MKSGVALVKLVRDTDFDRLYRTGVYRRSLGLPAEMDVVIRDDLSISGRVLNQASCSTVHAKFIATAEAVNLWRAVFNDPDSVVRAVVDRMAEAEDAEPGVPVVQAPPTAQAHELAEPVQTAPISPQEKEAPYTIHDALEDAHTLSEIGKNAVEIWRALRGSSDK